MRPVPKHPSMTIYFEARDGSEDLVKHWIGEVSCLSEEDLQASPVRERHAAGASQRAGWLRAGPPSGRVRNVYAS